MAGNWVNAVDTGADRVRRFSRFWTREIGLLQEGLLDTPHSLTEARVIYELGQVPEATATELVQRSISIPVISAACSPASPRPAWSRASARPTTAGASCSRSRARARPRSRARPPLGRPVLAAARAADAGRPGRLLAAMSTIEEVLGQRSQRAALVLRSPAPGRVRLGHPAPRRALRARVRLRRELRGARRPDRRRLRPAPRPGARASLDRRPRRRARRLGLLRRRRRRRREAPPPDRRPRRPRPPGRQPARRRVHPLRPRPRLPRADALDPEPARSRPPHLHPSRLRARREGAAEAAVRREDRLGDLAARALRPARVVVGSGQVALAACANWPHSSRGHARSFDLQDPAGSASVGGFCRPRRRPPVACSTLARARYGRRWQLPRCGFRVSISVGAWRSSPVRRGGWGRRSRSRWRTRAPTSCSGCGTPRRRRRSRVRSRRSGGGPCASRWT